MEDTLECEFSSKFHALTGVTLKERYQNLFTLLNDTQHALQLAGRKIELGNLHPTTPLEERFKIIALIRFKCVPDLLNILNTENSANIDRVLKCSSVFLKEAFADVTPVFLTSELFPNMSYCSKEKLLNKLSVCLSDEDKCDAYFEAIKDSYGLYLATKLFASCSCKLIMKYIKDYKINITARQLLTIVKKWPDLTESILEKLSQHSTAQDIGKKYGVVFTYVAKQDVSLFIKLYDKYSPNLKFGVRKTDAFIKCYKNLKSTKTKEIYKLFASKQIAKSFGVDFIEFYHETFPKCIHTLRDNLDDTLKLLDGLSSDSKKFEIFSKTFQKIYSTEVWSCSTLICPKLIELMCSEDRELFLNNYQRPSDIFEDSWIAYHKTEKSVPLLKEKISQLSNLKTRVRYLIALLNTCKINNDSSALLDVLKYINTKHHNENVTVLEKVLCSLSNLFNAKIFTEKHWEEIKLCINYFTLNNNSYYYYCKDLTAKYIFYRLSCNLPIKEELEKWVKDYPNEFPLYRNNAKAQKLCLAGFESLIPVDQKYEYIRYLFWVNQHNTMFRRNKLFITLNKECVLHIKKALQMDKNTYCAQVAASDCILQNPSLAEEMDVLENFLTCDYYDNNHFRVLILLTKTNPNILVKYFNLMLCAKSDHNRLKNFLRTFCTMYMHLKLPEEIIKICYNVFKESKNDLKTVKFNNAILAFSVLSTLDEFLSFSSLHHPSSLQIQSSNKPIGYIKLQSIIKALANICTPSKSLESIVQFCKGDYLKFAQKTFVTVSVHTLEKHLAPFLKLLQDRPVSVRKHALFIACTTLNRAQVYDMLLEFAHAEKSSSIQRIIFEIAFRMFLQNPNSFSWKVVTECAEKLDFTLDENAFDVLVKCDKISTHYFAEFIKFAWNIAETSERKTNVLELVTDTNISKLPGEFCVTIIKQNLLQSKQVSDLQAAVQIFSCKYLFYGEEKQERRVNLIFQCVKNFLGTASENIAVKVMKLKLTTNFIKQLCNIVMDNQCTCKIVFKQFLSMWEQTIKPYEAFEEYVYLQLTSIYLASIEKQCTILEIGKHVEVLCELLNNQDCLDITSFSKIVVEFLNRFYDLEFIGTSDENSICFIEGIVGFGNSYALLELVVSLMHLCNNSVSPIIKQKYDNIVNVVLKDSNKLLHVALQNYLKTKDCTVAA